MLDHRFLKLFNYWRDDHGVVALQPSGKLPCPTVYKLLLWSVISHSFDGVAVIVDRIFPF